MSEYFGSPYDAYAYDPALPGPVVGAPPPAAESSLPKTSTVAVVAILAAAAVGVYFIHEASKVAGVSHKRAAKAAIKILAAEAKHQGKTFSRRAGNAAADAITEYVSPHSRKPTMKRVKVEILRTVPT